jgi:hypothetical protein
MQPVSAVVRAMKSPQAHAANPLTPAFPPLAPKPSDMKTYPLILLLITIIPATLLAEGKHLFILSGQSNMAGLNPDVSFTPAVEKAFGKDNVTVVKDAQNGAPIRKWVYDYEFPDKRKINEKGRKNMGTKYRDLLAAVQAATQGSSYDSVTFIWMQGERDAKEKLADVYARSFHAILDQLKRDLKLKEINFVIGRISDFDLQDKNYQHWTRIRDIQVKLAEDNPRGEWVDTDDLNNSGNGLHYTKTGYATLGQRFAEKAIALVKKK